MDLNHIELSQILCGHQLSEGIYHGSIEEQHDARVELITAVGDITGINAQ